MFLIFLIANSIFIVFFRIINFTIWIYITFFFLSLLIILSFFTPEWKQWWKSLLKNFILAYLSYLNIVLMIIWLFFIFNYFSSLYWFSPPNIISIFLVLSILIVFFLVWAYIWNIQYIKLWYFSFFLLWWILLYYITNINIFYYFVAFLLAISATWNLLYFVKFWKSLSTFLYILMINIFIAIIVLLYKINHLSYIALSDLVQFMVLIILSVIIYLLSIKNKINNIESKLSQHQNELTLFGYSDELLSDNEKNFYKKIMIYKSKINSIVNFFIKSPNIVKFLFSLANVVPIIFASFYFFSNLRSSNYIKNEILYWIWIIIFFINFLLFKKVNWYIILQRFFAFFMINFIVYFTLIDFFWNNYLYLALWWIIWNLFSTIIILFIWTKKIFDSIDYLNWITVNFIWVFVNIFFLRNLKLNYYLELWIILLYIWLYLIIYRIIHKKIF